MNYSEMVKVLRMNIAIPNYRAVVVVNSKFEAEKLLQNIGTDPQLNYSAISMTLKHATSRGAIRFLLPNTATEIVRGIIIHQAFTLVGRGFSAVDEVELRAGRNFNLLMEVGNGN